MVNSHNGKIKGACKKERWLLYKPIRLTQPLASPYASDHVGGMLNIASICVGVVALILGVIAFFPLLGWAYWAIIPLALIGLGLGVLSDRNSGRNLNLVVIIVGIIRLSLGGGIV